MHVEEAATRILLAEGQSKIALAVRSRAGRPVLAQIDLELLDPHDKVVARTRRRERLQPGANTVAAFLPVSNFTPPDEDVKQLLWYRLRYKLTTAGADAAADGVAANGAQEGIISLSEITPELFELRVSAASGASAGQLYRVRVRAAHPLTSRPVGGVAVAAKLVFDETEEAPSGGALKLSGTTGRDGYATFDFTLPARIETDEGELEVTARRGDVVEQVESDVSVNRTTRILLTSDKPLYQPGQMLHLRALLLDHVTRRALADTEATLEIEDPEGTTVFTAPLKTSRFGVASCDWPIPDNTRLGDYTVRVEPDEGSADDATAWLRVKISRYELPNFSVSATPDRGYYLPGESAQVEVRGDYLFGQPLKRGRVRLVRETQREWNYKEQKYDIREGDKYEGELGDDGRFNVRLNLSEEHARLSGNSWQRFADLNYAAYVTDPTTNRTEQRRFQLRLTKEPIHIYVTQGNYLAARGLPLVFFVSTSYADGTPAACEVKFAPEPAVGGGEQFPRSIRTNAYGVAKVSGALLGADDADNFSVVLTAHDREGRAGRHVENFWLTSEPVVRIETDKTIYRAGESVRARVSTNAKDLRVFVDIVGGGRVLATERLTLRGGGAWVEFPFRPEFRNRVTLSAYSTDLPGGDAGDFPHDTRTIVFPRNRELKFDVRMSRASYQPGEEASAGVRVSNAAGRNVRSALGVVVFDKAVEERARTEQDFNYSYGFSDYFYQFWYGLESVGGVSARDIEQLDFARTPPENLDTVAELLLLHDDEDYSPRVFGSSDEDRSQSEVFAALASAQLKAAAEALAAHKEKTAQFPADAAELRRVLALAGVALGELRDPWGTPYQPVFSVERNLEVLAFKSAGADKRPGTEDDWQAARFEWFYFNPVGSLLHRALSEYHTRTGGFIRDIAALKSELARAGFDLDNLRDRWGQPYDFYFGINHTQYTLNVVSRGPDGRPAPAEVNDGTTDDFVIWSGWTDYFAETRVLLDTALAAHLKATGAFPRDEAAFADALRRAPLSPSSLRDPWQRPYYTTFRTEARYADRVRVEAGAGQARATQHTTLTPVTQQLEFITLRSAGADGATGTSDDFDVAHFSHIVSDQSARDERPTRPPYNVATNAFSGATGAIGGRVIDPNGAAVAGAAVRATHQLQTERVFETTTDDDGAYILRDLPAGLYTVRVESAGFRAYTVTDVPVQSSTLATVNLTLDVGAVAETVNVMGAGGGGSATDSTDAKVKAGVARQKTEAAGRGASKPPISTPRLRKDFPETLYWQPAVETDARGRTSIRFKLADNITTWKMSIIGSTETGELGTVEQEIRAFQPFFVEHDPPRILTEGDEINLPVVLRNYLDRAQPVALDIKPEAWFTLLGAARKESNVAAGDAARETFDFRAVASVKEGIQRITATGAEASDQIEKPVQVHPDGEELAETATHILREASVFEVSLPATAIRGSSRSELKIYPNLMAHAIEGIEAIMSRPYGCAEQTISATYPSLLVLRHYRRAGVEGATPTTAPAAAKAARYVRQGYERLLSYRSEGGGFSYWGRDAPDLALTAYAVRFLTDAREFTSVDETVLANAREWLTRQQRADGSWAASEPDAKEDGHRTAMLTAYVARVLAAQPPAAPRPTEQLSGTQPGETKTRFAQTKTQAAPPATPLRRALDYLATRVETIDEPYLIASYALAAIEGGESPDVWARAVGRLRALAREEAGGVYWSLESNTPFYGWGQAGRIETTALVVQALTRAGAQAGGGRMKNEKLTDENRAEEKPTDGKPADEKSTDEKTANPNLRPAPLSTLPARSDLVDRGLLFLLKNKDRYGVWLSTQATVNVLDALEALTPRSAGGGRGNKSVAAPSAAGAGAGQKAEVFVNGQSAGVLTLPAAHEPANPLSLDLTRFIAQGGNRVEIRRARGAALAATAQLVTTYYRAWADAEASSTHARPGDARALRLAVNFDRTAAATGDTVTCRVEAERVGHRGYGMLLAEIGLPPGADVDRATLERAMKESGWQFSHYDVLPDRLVAYLWPRAGGTNFSFTFRPRYGLNAKSAPSFVYDYYNPEARAVLAPTKFRVADPPKPAQARRE